MKAVGKLCAETHNMLGGIIRPGISTLELDAKAEEFIRANGGIPVFKGYRNFPNTLCACVNEEVIHCTPSNYILKDGDIVTLDLGASLDGFCGDTAKTYIIGKVNPDVEAFVLHGYLALLEGIEKAYPGNHVADISNAIAKYIKKQGYGAVERYVGHGIGRNIHEKPSIPNVEVKDPGAELVSGMVICIEPILTWNPDGKIVEPNEWKIVTADGKPACHWEHMIAIEDDGPTILTLRDEEIVHPDLEDDEL
jgi:methionyl aminopeptidase